MCCVALKAIYGQYFCLATGPDCMTNATSRPSAEALHFIMATEISNRNRSGDTTYTTNISVYKSKQMSTAAVAGNQARVALPISGTPHAGASACSQSRSTATAQRLKPKPTVGLSIHEYLQLLLLLLLQLCCCCCSCCCYWLPLAIFCHVQKASPTALKSQDKWISVTKSVLPAAPQLQAATNCPPPPYTVPASPQPTSVSNKRKNHSSSSGGQPAAA